MIKAAIVSLGCNKNLVDSEVMAGYLQKAEIALVKNRKRQMFLL